MEPQSTSTPAPGPPISDVIVPSAAAAVATPPADVVEAPQEIEAPEQTTVENTAAIDANKPQISKTEAKQTNKPAQPRGPIFAIACAAAFFVVLVVLAYFAYSKK